MHAIMMAADPNYAACDCFHSDSTPRKPDNYKIDALYFYIGLIVSQLTKYTVLFFPHIKMDRCEALKRDGARCTARATVNDVRHYCGMHHNSKMRSDEAYRIAYNQFITDEELRRQAVVAAELAQRQAAAAQRQQEGLARLAARRERNARALEDAPNISTTRILKYAVRLINLWHDETIPEYECAKAYAILSFMSPRHEGFVNLIRAVVEIINLSNHHEYVDFRSVPVATRTAAYTVLRTALEPYGEINYITMIPTGDRNRELIIRRQQREEAERLAAEAAQRRAEFERADRERPVVFQRDPDGGIDLRAFAADAQSVHRSSVQNTTQRIIAQLMARPVPVDQETVFEINMDFNNPMTVGWRSEVYKLTTINMFIDEYFSLEAFSVKYGDVVDRVWAFIRGHAERVELTVRLAQEISEGTGMCANGKMARLVNVLQGYDESLDVEPPREAFQSAIAALVNRPLSERESRARELFAEYRIPPEEYDAWLEPLLDAEA